MNISKIICELCGQEISKSNYTKHLRRHEIHPETFSDSKGKYQLNHDGLTCQFCGRESKNRNSLCNHERLCKENPDRQYINYPNSKNPNYRNGMQGKEPWNKGLSKYNNPIIAETSLRLRQGYKSGKYEARRGEANTSKRPEVREKISEAMKLAYSNKDIRTNFPSHKGYYKGIWCDSSWELAFVIYCLEHNILFHRNKKGFKYIWDGSEHTYYPDFFLEEEGTFVEIKGNKTSRDVCKIEQFNEPLLVMEKNEMVPILAYVIYEYGKDFYKLYDSSTITLE